MMGKNVFTITLVLLCSLVQQPIKANGTDSPVDWKSMITVAKTKRDTQGDLLSLQSYDETIRRGMSFLLDDHLKWFKGPAETIIDEKGCTQMPWVYYSNLQQNGEPFPNSIDRFVSYPAFHHSLLIRTFIRYSKYSEDTRALAEAVKLADWNIAHSTPGDWAFGNLPYSTFQEKKPGGFRDKTGLMPDKAAIMALAYIDLYKATNKPRFLKAAQAIAQTLADRQRPNGTWPFRVDPKTEKVIEEYTSSVIYAVQLFESLDKINGNNKFCAKRDRTWNWLLNGPVKTKEFRGFYEDIPASPKGRTNYDCLDTIRYLLANRTKENGYLEIAKELNGWVEKVFMDKIKGFEPAEGIREQLQCNVVMGIHSLNWASMLRELAEATGDEMMRQRAIQTANYITYYLQPDNRIVVGLAHQQWWYSCHTGVVLYLLDFVENKQPIKAGPTATVNGKKPNIVFILADDIGWADLPSYGNTFNEAPNIDKLARQGMRFTNAYAACPVCSPTRASLMSGQYPARVGVIDFIPGHWRPWEKVTVPKNRTQYLPTEVTTMAEMLKSAGYTTAMFGKWHLGQQNKCHPLDQGFDQANVGNGYFNTRFNPPRKQSSEKIQMERITDFGIDFIRENKDKPFFLYLCHWSVHCLLDAEQAVIDKYVNKPKADDYTCNAVYAAVIEHLDNSIGRLTGQIEKLGLADNTIIVFYSDNGGSITEHRYPGIKEGLMPMIVPDKRDMYKQNPLRYMMTTNAPLRGQKGNLYEGGIREPLIVKWPGKIKAGSTNKTIVSTVDFYKTFLELSGASIGETQVLDGQSLVPALLNGAEDTQRTVFWHYPVYHHGVPASAVRKGDWKLIENLEDGQLELFNLHHDASETTNLIEAFPQRTAELYGLLKKWRKDVGAELPQTNPDFDETKRYQWGKHPDRKR